MGLAITLPAAARAAAALGCLALLGGCAALQQQPPPAAPAQPTPKAPAQVKPKADGKYYKDDGPPEVDAVDWRTVPDAIPSFSPIKRGFNRPYEVFGVRYVPFTDYASYSKRGEASWYGRRYHGRKTSSGEVYNMYEMTAAHTVLPIPSYVRVTRVDDGRAIVVRVNDRGPFLNDRIIDLSYVAARKLGVVADGTAEVLVEAILPGEGGAVVAPARPKPAEVGTAPGSSQKLTELSSNYLQIGAFSSLENANSFAATVNLPATLQVATISVISAADNLHRVLIGPYPTKEAAESDLDRLHDAGMEALLKIF